MLGILRIYKRFQSEKVEKEPKYTNKDIKDITLLVGKFRKYNTDLRDSLELLHEIKKYHTELISMAIEEIKKDIIPEPLGPVEEFAEDYYTEDLYNTVSLWEDLYEVIKYEDIMITE